MTPLFRAVPWNSHDSWPGNLPHWPSCLPHHWLHGDPPTHWQARLQHPHVWNTTSGSCPSFKKVTTLLMSLPARPLPVLCTVLYSLDLLHLLSWKLFAGRLHVCAHACRCACACVHVYLGRCARGCHSPQQLLQILFTWEELKSTRELSTRH